MPLVIKSGKKKKHADNVHRKNLKVNGKIKMNLRRLLVVVMMVV
jgi:hypothetical protein